MSGVLFFFFLRLLMLLYSVSSLNQNFNGNINLWPKPWKIQFPNNVPQSIPLSSSFKIKFPNHNRFLNAAVRRYHRLILTEKYHPVRPPFSFTKNPQLRLLNILRISVSDLWTPLKIDMDESYNLSISSSGRSVNADLMAETVWGAMRGLETFSQLTWGEDPVMIFADVLIWDKPLFSHRGILLDTSRNFYRVKDIKRTIMAMSWNKLNVFHWHITDSHSFPIVLPSEPDLAAKGAYSSKMQYSPNDVKQIIQFGMEHGVRVMPEIDTPGHTGSWAEAYPEIVTCSNMDWWPPGTQWQDRLASEPGTGQLNPLHPKTYQVLHNVLRDVADLFPEQFLHIGYDEVIPGCWKVDPNIRTFLSNTNSSLSTLLEIFFNSTHSFVVSLKKIPVYWEDVLLDPIIHLHPSLLRRSTTILQTWNNGPANTKLLVQLGFRTIVSSSEFYYLDCGHGGFVGNDSRYDRQTRDEPGEPFNYQGGNGGSWCAPFKTWQRIYDYDITHGLSKEEAELVLGGEVAMWSEQADPTVLDSRIWPRASAMAEALWSGNRDDNGKKRYGEALDRLNEWRERLVGRGIKAEPLQPLWCLTHPGMCNVHNTQ